LDRTPRPIDAAWISKHERANTFESLLPAPPFLRLSRSLILNRDRLRKVETLSRAEARVTLDGVDEPVTLGRTAAQRLREALGS
jgi:two-component system, LytTR family, response regulator